MRIGFLAMSGIRAHDPELLRRGLTLPGFVERSRQIAALPSLGLLWLAACTPSGHALAYFEAAGEGELPPELFDCDLVAISTFSAQVFEAYAIAARLRAAGVRVAIGGLHASVLPEEALQHADYVVVGEGEHVWPAVVADRERGSPRIFRASDYGPVDVAKLPVPRYDLLGSRPYNRFTVQASRGCPYRCSFCASSIMLRAPYRKRPVGDVVRDVRAVLARWPGAFIELADDNTFVDAEWGLDLVRALRPLGIRWFTETDVSVADHPELLREMARAGCRQVLVGLETPGPYAGIDGLEEKSDFKARRAPDYEAAVRRIQAAGITVNGCFVLGLDGQTPAVFDAVAEFAERTSLWDVQVTLQTAFPGTPLYERLSAEERILQPGRWDLCTLFDLNYVPRGMTAEELRNGLYGLCDRLYSAQAIARRRSGFFAHRARATFVPTHAFPRATRPRGATA